MAIKKYWDFADEGSVPADFTELEGGSGAVSIASNHLRVDNGGTASGDYACAVFDTALNASAYTVIYGEVKFSGVTGAWTPLLVGLLDSASEPVAMSESARNAAWRIGQEYQMSSGADSTDRIQLRMKNESDGARWNYVASTEVWQAAFAYTRAFFDEGSYYRFVIILDGTTSPKRTRSLVYGITNDISILGNAVGGWALNYDSTWRNFTTGSGNIDPIDNSLWALFGDPINAHASRSAQVIMDFRRIMIGEIDTANLDEFAWSNRSSAGGSGNYEILKRLNPMSNAQTQWTPHERQVGTTDYTTEIARGADAYVKDAYVFFDGTTYWMFYQRDNAGEGEVCVSSTTDILGGTWGSETVISVPGAGEDKHEFPWVTKYDGTWYLFFGVEEDAGTWEIQYRTTTATNPTSGWSAATTILTKGAVSDFDEDGVTQPILIWHSGTFAAGVWYMLYGGVDGTGIVWEGGLAKSTTGITGTYTKDAGNPIINPGTFSTTVDGAHADQMTITVASTTGLTAGDMLIQNDQPYAIIEVISVDSGTTFTASIETTLANLDPIDILTSNSPAPRVARRINGYWVIYVTSFKFTAGEETVSTYVATTNDAALEDCTFREIRYGDAMIDAVYPIWNLDLVADENFGGAFSELSPVGVTPMGRMYSLSDTVASVTTAIDLIRISAPSDAIVVVHKVIVTQETEFADAQSEMLDVQFHRGSTDGSGGATPSAVPLEVGDAAFGGTTATGNGTQSTEGVILHAEAFHVAAGFAWAPTPEERIVLSPSGRLIVELPTAPDDSVDFRVSAYFEEIGG